jgi:hypothetical protein
LAFSTCFAICHVLRCARLLDRGLKAANWVATCAHFLAMIDNDQIFNLFIRARRRSMMCKLRLNWVVLSAAIFLIAGMAQAVSIDLVFIENAGNTADSNGYGAVDHTYSIGKYEVTAGQYAEFLNAKAQSDPKGLYNSYMSSDALGCKIQRTGSDGNYSYSVAANYASRPVNYVSFWDAARFTNWLHNGQGTGDTETGAYTLTASGMAANTVAKNAGATWWIPTENEWYKAAYSNNPDAMQGLVAPTSDYFLYATGSNTAPGHDLTDPSGNNANYRIASDQKYPIDSGKYTTVVGQFGSSASPYGTFDQGGNILEWADAIAGLNNASRVLRG